MLSNKISIGSINVLGSDVSAKIQDIRNDAEKLQSIFGSQNVPNLEDLYSSMNDWRFSLAAVGQMKAGKSSFLNAIINAPDLLPSDVNPWTTVVTKLRYGHPDEQDFGGRFTFFSEDDWTEIISRSTEDTRYLNDLIVDFDQTVLSKQFVDMRQRAKTKLGNLYPLLLGTSHNYETVTKSILKRYVAAGVDAVGKEAGNTSRAGYYADITKYAEIFFPKNIFEIPTVVIDTPGVNDPFLVRDEFTCQVLDDSDVYLMLMSVHQPLTPFDLNFIRILTKQSNKRIIIVINRVDELDDFATNAKLVLADVTNRLRDAGLIDHIQAVVAGSATWAQAARDANDEHIDFPYAEMRKMVKSLYGLDVTDDAKCLEIASGLHPVLHALENGLNETPGKTHIQQLKQEFLSCVAACKSLLETELRDSSLLVNETDLLTARDAHIDLLEQKLDDARVANAKFNAASATIQSTLQQDFSKTISDTKVELTMALRDIVKAECETLSEKIEQKSKAKELDVDAVAIQDRIFQFSQGFFTTKQARSIKKNELSEKPLLKLTDHIWNDTNPTQSNGVQTSSTFAPVLPDVAESLKISLTTRNAITFWKRSKLSQEDFFKQLEKVISREMAGTISAIQRYTTEALIAQHLAYQKKRTNFITATSVILNKNISTLSASLAQANDTTVVDEKIHKDAKKQIKALTADLKKIELIATKYA